MKTKLHPLFKKALAVGGLAGGLMIAEGIATAAPDSSLLPAAGETAVGVSAKDITPPVIFLGAVMATAFGVAVYEGVKSSRKDFPPLEVERKPYKPYDDYNY